MSQLFWRKRQPLPEPGQRVSGPGREQKVQRPWGGNKLASSKGEGQAPWAVTQGGRGRARERGQGEAGAWVMHRPVACGLESGCYFTLFLMSFIEM